MATNGRRSVHDWFPEGRVVQIATLRTASGASVPIGLDSGALEAAVLAGRVDAYIVAAEAGFSPLGVSTEFICKELWIQREELDRLAEWNQHRNNRVTLIALPSRNPASRLRGVVLAPGQTSACYEQFARPLYGMPYRDFFYNVTYEAVAWAAEEWRASNIALSHLSAGNNFHADIATCNAEAVAHFCDSHPNAVSAFWFLGCCISPDHLKAIQRLNQESQSGKHRPIETQVVTYAGYHLMHIEWDHSA